MNADVFCLEELDNYWTFFGPELRSRGWERYGKSSNTFSIFLLIHCCHLQFVFYLLVYTHQDHLYTNLVGRVSKRTMDVAFFIEKSSSA